MSDLPVPAVLAILLLMLLVLIVLIALVLRGRSDAPEAAAPDDRLSSDAPDDRPASAERTGHTAAASEDAGPDGPAPAGTELPGVEADDVGPASSSPADDDPRP